MVNELLTGGDLRYYLSKDRLTFNEKQAQFIMACVILAVDFLHSNGIIHRDIRPENVIMDSSGYCKLVDFGQARLWRELNASDTSGAAGYMAPEIVLREKQTTSVDYFSIGILAHELMLKRRPWPGEDRATYMQKLKES